MNTIGFVQDVKNVEEGVFVNTTRDVMTVSIVMGQVSVYMEYEKKCVQIVKVQEYANITEFGMYARNVKETGYVNIIVFVQFAKSAKAVGYANTTSIKKDVLNVTRASRVNIVFMFM